MYSSTIVVAVDGSKPSLAAVQWAAREAQRRRTSLRIVTVVLGVGAFHGALGLPTAIFQEDEIRARSLLANAEEVAHATIAEIAAGDSRVDDTPVHADLLAGPVVATILDAAHGAAALVVGSHGLSQLPALILGSTAAALVRHATCPVTVVRDTTCLNRPSDAPVVVGVDGSARSMPALATAFADASRRGVRLIAVHSWLDTDVRGIVEGELDDLPSLEAIEEAVLAEALAGFSSEYPDVKVDRTVVFDGPAHRLAELSKEAALIVVGSRGRGGFAGLLLGSTVHTLLHTAECPVTVARSEQHG